MDGDIQKKKKEKIAFVGLGRVGSVLAALSVKAGYEFIGGVGRNSEKAKNTLQKIGKGRLLSLEEVLEADIIFITVNDEQIKKTAEQLSGLRKSLKGKTFAHCSGFYDSSLLLPLEKKGAHIGSFHPVFPFVSFDFALQNLAGSYAAVEGSAEEKLREFGERLGLKVLPIDPSAKPFHHIACVHASGLMLALLLCSEKIASRTNLPFQVYLHLAEKALQAAKAFSLKEAITGPWKRKDRSTIEAHLKLTPFPEVYRSLLKFLMKDFSE